MSALGQEQTYALQKAMSAITPIATAKADIRNRSCLLYPRKRTYAVQLTMSALGQKRTCTTITDRSGLRAPLRRGHVSRSHPTFAAVLSRASMCPDPDPLRLS